MKWWDSIRTRFNAKIKDVEPVSEVQRLVYLAYGHLLMEEYDQAQSVLLEAVQFRSAVEDPETVAFLLTSLESTWIFREQFEDGIAFFSDYISRYSRDFAAYRGRGGVLWYSGRLHEAIEDYSRSLELKPMDIMTLSGRGQVFAELGNHAKAMEDLDLALESLRATPKPDPGWARWYEQIEAFVHNGRGFALGGLGEIERAMDEFQLSIEMSPDNAWVYHNRGRVNDSAGNLERTIEDYEKALEKRKPPLNPLRKEHVRLRLAQLGLNAK